MIKHKYKGLFIAFEGLDGSGSSTQAELLVKRLKHNGICAFGTKEPTNNLIGGLIRGVLTRDWGASPECLQLLFAADRAHHLQREIIPIIDRGDIIITDRYFFSTIAFGSLEIDKKWLIQLNDKFILPDITFFIRVSPTKCIERIGKSRNQFELFEEEKKLKRVLKTYDELAKEKKYRIITVDGKRSIEKIELEVYANIEKFIIKNNFARVK